MSKIRSTLSKFLGESFDMDDVVDAVTLAEKKTNVRKEFLFAVLDKETDLGRFTGGCTYEKSKMGSTNLNYFKEICDDLGYNYKKMKVSCALSYGIGGAMGVAQFMPSTWMGYKDSIASKTGNDPADPWKLEDGIMGMALYLKNKGGDKKSGEYQAAAMYYCGGNWKRTVCKNYANTVISWSKGYDEYFK
jgi:membrane-bound lytic murein transglycosylase B